MQHQIKPSLATSDTASILQQLMKILNILGEGFFLVCIRVRRGGGNSKLEFLLCLPASACQSTICGLL